MLPYQGTNTAVILHCEIQVRPCSSEMCCANQTYR